MGKLTPPRPRNPPSQRRNRHHRQHPPRPRPMQPTQIRPPQRNPKCRPRRNSALRRIGATKQLKPHKNRLLRNFYSKTYVEALAVSHLTLRLTHYLFPKTALPVPKLGYYGATGLHGWVYDQTTEGAGVLLSGSLGTDNTPDFSAMSEPPTEMEIPP